MVYRRLLPLLLIIPLSVVIFQNIMDSQGYNVFIRRAPHKTINTNTTIENVNVNKILLKCYYRAGSTIVSEFFNGHPEVYYSYEPLRASVGTIDLATETILTDIYDCKFNRVDKAAKRSHNYKHWHARYFCGIYDNSNTNSCLNKSLSELEEVCKKQNIRVIKVIRIEDFRWVGDLLNEVKVIHVVRDPRAMLNSILSIKGKLNAVITYVCKFCNVALNDDKFMVQLTNTTVVKYTLIRYEDAVFHPWKISKQLRHFTRLPFDLSMEKWVKNLEDGAEETNNSDVFPYSTNRKSPRLTARNWKKKLPFKAVQEVQKCCAEHMERFGYEFMKEKDLIDESKPGFLPTFGE